MQCSGSFREGARVAQRRQFAGGRTQGRDLGGGLRKDGCNEADQGAQALGTLARFVDLAGKGQGRVSQAGLNLRKLCRSYAPDAFGDRFLASLETVTHDPARPSCGPDCTGP